MLVESVLVGNHVNEGTPVPITMKLRGLGRHSLAFLSCKFHSILWPSMIDDGREVGHVPPQWGEILF